MKKKLVCLQLIFLFIIGFMLPSFAQNDAEITKEVEKYAQQVMTDWGIPGMGLGIIKDGKTIYLKGLGLKAVDMQAPVDENTSFQIASVSKSFTAAIISMLADEGKLKWDDPVIKHLPDFKLYDKWATENLQIRDIMTHRTGLPEQSLTYISKLGYMRKDTYHILQLIEPASSPRTTYAYNNATFVIAEQLIERLTGKTWEENIQERIFNPLGMHSSTYNGDGFLAATNAAHPHGMSYKDGKITSSRIQGENRALEWLTGLGPAGSIVSTANDMLKWIDFHLHNKVADGKPLISKENFDFLHYGQTIIRQDSTRTSIYGQCWFMEQNNRYRMIFHTGTARGFTALCAMVPELDLGTIILVNSSTPSESRYAIMRRLVDLYLNDGVMTNYNKEALDTYKKDREKPRSERTAPPFVPALKLDEYVDIYTNTPILGDIEIKLTNDALNITIGSKRITKPMSHVSGNRFQFSNDGSTFNVTFSDDYNGKITGLTVGDELPAWSKK
ncbi:MAG: serine hydrolase [Prevotellaceae bacterium]|nr:serine hydrolase [Prevotellaceae bacterium]